MPSPRNLVNSVEVLLAELWDEPVAFNALGRRALGQYNVSALQTPCKQHLCKIVSAALRNLVELGVRPDLLSRAGDLVLRSQRRVGSRQDVVVQAELDELCVWQERVNLNLVDRRLDFRELHELLQALDRPVGHADRAHLAGLVELLHRAPC